MTEPIRHRRFGNTRQLPSGRWQARFTGPDGHSHSAPDTFDSRPAAEKWLAQQFVHRAEGTFVDERAGRIRLEEYADAWARTVVHLRPSSLQRDLDYLDRYILSKFGNHHLSEIDTAGVKTWTAELTERGLAPATVAKAVQVLAKILDAAAEEHRIGANPARGIKLARPQVPELTVLSPEGIRMLADAIDPRYANLVLFDCWTGLRIGELVALTVGDIDTTRRRVKVTKTITEVAGHQITGAPKTRAGRREVPMPPWLAEHLADAFHGAHRDDVAFPAPGGGPLRIASFRSRIWRNATKAIKLPELRIHDMRHTAVSLWVNAGIDPKKVAAWAGHASVVTVLNRYAHPDDEGMESLDHLGRPSSQAGRVVPIR